jgi:predicted membrane channel-forming protein YqfA (hemolysin III family)
VAAPRRAAAAALLSKWILLCIKLQLSSFREATCSARQMKPSTKSVRITRAGARSLLPSGEWKPRLLLTDECPEFLRFNNHLSDFHRPQMPFLECIFSLLYTHNQSGIIYWYIIGFAGNVALFLYFSKASHECGMFGFNSLFVAGLIHFPVSTAYHLLMPISVRVKITLNSLDYVCISLLATLTGWAIAYPYLLQSPYLWHHRLLSSISPVVNSIVAFTPLYDTLRPHRVKRALLTAVSVTISISPVLHESFMCGCWTLGMSSLMLLILALLIFTSHFPEVFVQSKLALTWLNSHANMHFCIVAQHFCFYFYIGDSLAKIGCK